MSEGNVRRRRMVRVTLYGNRSVAYYIDALALLPSDALVAGYGHNYSTNGLELYIEHPGFKPIFEDEDLPRYYVLDKIYRSLLGEVLMRPDKIAAADGSILACR